MFKEIAGFASLMKQAHSVNDRMEDLGAELKTKRVVGSAGGGMVEVETDGLGECLAVRIDPLLVERQDREMIEDLLPAAINQAQAKAKALHSEAMLSLSRSISIPGLDVALAKLMNRRAGEGAANASDDDDDSVQADADDEEPGMSHTSGR